MAAPPPPPPPPPARPPSPGPGYVWNEATRQWVPSFGAATGGNTTFTQQGGGQWGGSGGSTAPANPTGPAGPLGPPTDDVELNASGEYTDGSDGKNAFAGSAVSTSTGEQILPAKYTNATAAVANDVYETRLNRDRLLEQYEKYKPIEAPKASTPTLGPAAQAADVSVGPAAQSTAPTVAPAAEATAARVGPAAQSAAAPQITAQQVGQTQIGPLERASAATIAENRDARASTVMAERSLAAPMQTEEQAAVRSRQLQLLDNLEQSAAGTGPSIAELQMRRGNEAAQSNQLAIAGMSKGYAANAARRSAARNIGKIQQQGNLDASMLRAKEQLDARDQLLRGYEGTRGADIGVATTQAGFQQQSNLQNAQLGTQAAITTGQMQTDVSKANAAADAARAIELARMQTDVSKTNAGATNTTAIRQAELNQQGNLANAANALDAAKSNQGATVQTNITNTQQSNEMQRLQAQIDSTTGLTNAQAKNRMAELQAQITAQNGIANAAQQNEITKLQAQLTTQNNQFNTQAKNDFLKSAAGMELQTNLANLNSQLQTRGMDEEARRAALQAYLDNQRATMAWNTLQAGLQDGDDDFKAQLTKDLITGAINQMSSNLAQGGKMAGQASDRRVKTDVQALYSDERGKSSKAKLLAEYEGGGGEVEDLLDKLSAYKYRYKDPKAEGAAPGQRYGVMAQDLERSPMGASIVMDDGGVKKIDTNQAIGVLLAAAARMHARVKKVEGRR